MQYTERLYDTDDWATLFLVGCFALFAFAKFLYPKRFEEFIMLPITNKYFLVHGKNDEIYHPFNIMLFATQVISVSLFIYLLIRVLDPVEVSKQNFLFLQICTAYSVFVLIKFSIEKIVGNIFSIDSIINQYLYQKLTYRNFLGIIMFFGNLLFLYIFTPSGMSMLLFLGAIFIFNAIALFYSYKNNGTAIMGNLSYFILYLCALEISPYVILYKTFV